MNKLVVEDKALHTVLVEIERILSDLSLVRNEGDVDDLDPLTLSKFEGQRSGVDGGQQITSRTMAHGCC